MNRLRACLIALSIFPSFLASTESRPWLFENDFVVYVTATDLIQNYRIVKAKHHNIHNSTVDNFTTLSAGLSGMDFSGELEATVAHTKRQSFDCDNLRFTGRYRLMDDIGGENLFSMTAGITVTQAFMNSLRDVSSFHHGQIEGEFNIAFGKETSHLDLWQTRWWGLFGIGCGDHGVPWLHAHFSWAYNFCNEQQLSFFAEFLRGLGNKKIIHPFRGYGNIRHQSVDLGVNYSYFFNNSASLSLQYAHRVYAKNFPRNANLVQLQFQYPFAIANLKFF